MPKRSNPPRQSQARKPVPKRQARERSARTDATSLTYAAWRAQAAAVLGRAGTLPEREWKRLYVLGTDVAQAAKQAELYRDHMSAARRSR